MDTNRMVRIFAGAFVLISLALGAPGSPLFVERQLALVHRRSSARTCCRAASRASARWRSS